MGYRKHKINFVYLTAYHSAPLSACYISTLNINISLCCTYGAGGVVDQFMCYNGGDPTDHGSF